MEKDWRENKIVLGDRGRNTGSILEIRCFGIYRGIWQSFSDGCPGLMFFKFCKIMGASFVTQISGSVISRLTPAPSFPWIGRYKTEDHT